MSCPVNLQALPSGVLEKVFTPETVRGRTSMNSLTALRFPKSRSALWDGNPAGEKLRLQLCARRKPRLLLMEKALRLAQRHARHKPRLLSFLLGSVCVDADEEGVTVTLDRFDPGRDQTGSSCRVPSALLPGDVLVPWRFSTQTETTSDAVVLSEAELHHCFKELQQCVSSRQTLDLSQLMKVRGHVVCSQQADAAAFSLSWSAVCPSVSVEAQPIRAVPIIPTALLRSLTGLARAPAAASRQRGFLTMDQTRKLLLLLESDPKASNLPLVGLWLSGVTHVSSPQVWAWCVRFLYSSALQDRVLSESRCFLLVLFASTHRAPQFFQCRGPGPEPGPAPQLDYQLLTASQCVTLYQQVVSVEGRTLQCELGSEDHSRQTEVFREAQTSFSRAGPPAARLSVSDQDSGVEDEDLSPRPSPSPHPPAQQARRVQPSVPELSLLIDSSFTSNQNARQDPGSAHRNPPAVDRKSAPPTRNTTTTTTSSSAPRPAAPPHLHSTPNSNLQEPCCCCSTHTYDCTSIFSSPGLPPAPLPPSTHHHTPPPSSLPPSTHHHTPPPSSLPPSTHHHTPPPSSLPPSSHHHTPPPPSSLPPAPLLPSSHHHTPPPPSSLPPAPLPPSSHHHTPLSSRHHTPSPFSTPPPPCPCSPSPSPPPWFSHPSCVNQGCDQVGGVVPSDTYQLLLHQDRQLRLLQAQVQMLLEAQGRLQSSGGHVEALTPRSTASIAVGTGASLFWGDPVRSPLPQQEVQAPPPSSTTPPSSHADLSAIGSVSGAEDIKAVCSPSDQHGCSVSGLQSPVLGESASMYRAEGEQQSFYHNLMSQLTSRLQESDSKQEVEEESMRRSLSASSQSRRRPSCGGDPVLRATVRQLQRLGVDVDREDLTESERRIHQTVESSSTLASINPAAVLSRLSVSEPTASCVFPEGSVDLSLEANAIALRYLSDSQLSGLCVGGHAPRLGPASSHAPRPGRASNHSLLSPSNMSLATRKYMRRYGLIEEEDGEGEEEEEEEKEEEEDVRGASARQPLTEALNVKLLPQSQLIRDLRPKMQLLAGGGPNTADKENCSSRRPSLMRASSRQAEGSVGNILDLSRLRQLPKLF